MNKNELFERLAVSVGVVGAYALLRYLPQPMVSLDGIRVTADSGFAWDAGVASVAALGIMPFLTGFLLVEIYSLAVPWGRRTRESGPAGRRRLNQLAIGVSLAVCLVQAAGIGYALEGIRTPGGVSIVADPGWMFRLIAVTTLVAGSVAAFALCNLATARGLGNGFCLLIVFEIAIELVVSSGRPSFDPLAAEKTATFLALAVGLVFFFDYFQRRPVSYRISTRAHGAGACELPAWPQGSLPLSFAYGLLSLPATIGPAVGRDAGPFFSGSVFYLAGMAVALPLLRLATVHAFSSRRRIEHNLPQAELSADFDGLWKRRFHVTTGALTAVAVAYVAVEVWVFEGTYLIALIDLALITAIGADLLEEWRFRGRNPAAERAVELDNVHLALHARHALAARGIDCLLQAVRFRSLFFFLRPLYKIHLLVPADRLGEAREWLDELDPRIV